MFAVDITGQTKFYCDINNTIIINVGIFGRKHIRNNNNTVAILNVFVEK